MKSMQKTMRIWVVLGLLMVIPAGMVSADSFELKKEGGVENAYITLVAGALGAFTAYQTPIDIDGIVCAVETNPGATAPTGNYDIVITNEDGRNICGDTGTGAVPNQDGVLANRSASLTQYTKLPVNGGYDCVMNVGKLTITATSNAVVGATVVIRIAFFGTN